MPRFLYRGDTANGPKDRMFAISDSSSSSWIRPPDSCSIYLSTSLKIVKPMNPVNA